MNEPGNCGEIIAVVYELTKMTRENFCSPIGHNNTKHCCAQSGASIRLTVLKWSGESRYPGAFPPLLENFRRALSPYPTDCPWVSVHARWKSKWSLAVDSLPLCQEKPLLAVLQIRRLNITSITSLEGGRSHQTAWRLRESLHGLSFLDSIRFKFEHGSQTY